MKLVNQIPLGACEGSNASFSCAGPGASRLRVSLLEDWLARVSFLPEGTWRLDRTWMIQGASPDATVPREGRYRDDVSVFSQPSAVFAKDENGARLYGSLFSTMLSYSTGGLAWSLPDGRVFARDLPERAYCRDEHGTTVCHYMERKPDEIYYGFGERTGPLDKKGLRMEMRNLDALGYDAATTDPLYKHWPIYITMVPSLGLAYGLVYDNLADTVFDMGREIDAYHGDYRSWKAAGGDVDYYLVFGPDLPSVV
ncbi:MAG: hypothetical protein JXM71_05750, partial [Spirochaetales bacterium]|nr:hypothetical protein [Spirochaetales bacterium]